MKQPCVHFNVCKWVVINKNDCHCLDYRPDILPVLKRWRSILKQKQSHYHVQLDVEWGIISVEKRVIAEIIKHLERSAK